MNNNSAANLYTSSSLPFLASSKHMTTAINTSSGAVAIGIAHDRVLTTSSPLHAGVWCMHI